jgi:ABC-type multidrug transport system ATPase subunit
MGLAIHTTRLNCYLYFDSFCAVDGVDLAVECGSLFGFLGPQAAGKSTTIKMLTGILVPSSGPVFALTVGGARKTDVELRAAWRLLSGLEQRFRVSRRTARRDTW